MVRVERKHLSQNVFGVSLGTERDGWRGSKTHIYNGYSLLVLIILPKKTVSCHLSCLHEGNNDSCVSDNSKSHEKRSLRHRATAMTISSWWGLLNRVLSHQCYRDCESLELMHMHLVSLSLSISLIHTTIDLHTHPHVLLSSHFLFPQALVLMHRRTHTVTRSRE